jgi:hypothetical protein
MKPEKCVLVLGMHRSGTSALTGILNILGADLGLNMMKAAEDNERGFFENRSIYNINEKILESLGSSWDSPFPLPENWWREKRMDACRNEIGRAHV